MLGHKFVSVIKINGKPILPPVMTEKRIAEMQEYKNQAIELEQQLKNNSNEPDETMIQTDAPFPNLAVMTSSEFMPGKTEETMQQPENDENNTTITLKELQSLQNLKIDSLETSSDSEPFSTSPRKDAKSSSWFSLDDTDTEETISIPGGIIVDGIGDMEHESPRAESILRTPLTEIESCASLASTELGKYMDISPEDHQIPPQFERTESASSCSTVKESEPTLELKKINKSISCDVIVTENEKTPKKKHVRRSSYTLECPSPALTAQVDLYKEKGMKFPDDMCSIRRNSFDNVPRDSDEKYSNKKSNLNRYLETVARFPMDQEEEQIESPMLTLTFEELLAQQEDYFKQLKSQLMLKYKDQMAMLLKKQDDIVDDEVVSKEFQFEDEPVIRPRPRAIIREICHDAVMSSKFDRVSAAVKGYLTRRLLRTEKVQEIIKTIRDTLEFALNFNNETPIKSGRITPGEATLHQRILQQLTSSCHDFHDVFFKLSTQEQMEIIAQDRELLNEKTLVGKKGDNLLKRNLSTATMKVLERKKVKLQNDFSNNALSMHDKNVRSKSAFSLRSKKGRGKSDGHRPSSGKGHSPRTSSPRLQSRLANRSSLPADRLHHHRSARRNLSNSYPQDGSRTFRA